MGITLSWDDEVENLLIYKFDGKWTWGDFLQKFDEEVKIAETLNGQRYDVVADTLNSQPLPPGSGISHVYGVFKRYPQNWGKTIIVTQSRFLKMMVSVGQKVHADARDAFILGGSLEEARTIVLDLRLVEQENPQAL